MRASSSKAMEDIPTMTKMIALIAAAAALCAGQAVAQDVAAGQKAFGQCKVCHTVEAGGKNGVGPNLNGVFGRKSATKEGFNYSDAMKNSGITWSEAEVAAYIADPKGKVPGNKMAFVGVKNPQTVTDIIAYLKEATK